ncbi:MAG: hypothetical protein 2 [Zeugodacus cucurbitae negev-like virus]|nr:MAG: hypothetical protein 2 [Zeugodacus cucurbitae negev-like virus]
MLLIIILAILHYSSAVVYTDGETLQSMCCKCRDNNLNCAYCKLTMLQGTHACDIRDDILFANWVLYVNTFIANHNLDVPYRSQLSSCGGYMYFYAGNNYPSFITSTYNCQRVTKSASCVFGSGVYNVFGCYYTAVSPDLGVMPANCGTKICEETNPYFCYANGYYRNAVWYTNVNYENKVVSDPSYKCFEMDASAMLTALKSMGSPCTALSNPTFTNTSDTAFITTYESDTYANLLNYLNSGKITAKRHVNSAIYTHCSNSTSILTMLDGLPYTYWSNVLIIPRGACSAYIPFNSTHDICGDDIFGNFYTSGCPDTFRTVVKYGTKVVLSYPVLTPPPPDVPNYNVSCDTLNSHFACAYKDWIDYFIKSFGTVDFDFDLDRYAQLQHEYASERQAQTRDWLTWWYSDVIQFLWDTWQKIFLECIEPFLEAVIEATSQVVLAILNTYLDLIKKSQHFIDVVTDFITKILDVLLQLLALILKIFLGLLLKLEQHFLIFEYLILFVVVNYYLINNNIVSLVVVFLVMVIFGIDRHSPSVLLYFYNSQYNYVNLTQYQDTRFNWSYSLTYHPHPGNSSVSVTLPKPGLNNSYELIPLPNRTLTLPPPYHISPSPIACSGSLY